MTPMELNKMIEGCQARREDKAFAVSWYVSNLMNIHLKHGIKAKELARPFLHEKTIGEVEQEKEAFLASFKRQREEAEDGDGSEHFD